MVEKKVSSEQESTNITELEVQADELVEKYRRITEDLVDLNYKVNESVSNVSTDDKKDEVTPQMEAISKSMAIQEDNIESLESSVTAAHKMIGDIKDKSDKDSSVSSSKPSTSGKNATKINSTQNKKEQPKVKAIEVPSTKTGKGNTPQPVEVSSENTKETTVSPVKEEEKDSKVEVVPEASESVKPETNEPANVISKIENTSIPNKVLSPESDIGSTITNGIKDFVNTNVLGGSTKKAATPELPTSNGRFDLIPTTLNNPAIESLIWMG